MWRKPLSTHSKANDLLPALLITVILGGGAAWFSSTYKIHDPEQLARNIEERQRLAELPKPPTCRLDQGWASVPCMLGYMRGI